MKIFYDTEFIEDGVTVDLLSIGMIREDGETYYAEFAECKKELASDWVKWHVLPYLTGSVKPRIQIRSEIYEFVGKKPEFWASYAAYDWIALCQLFGKMIDLPAGWPMFCRDLQQLRNGRDLTPVKLLEPKHNALSDAMWVRNAWHYLTREFE